MRTKFASYEDSVIADRQCISREQKIWRLPQKMTSSLYKQEEKPRQDCKFETISSNSS